MIYRLHWKYDCDHISGMPVDSIDWEGASPPIKKRVIAAYNLIEPQRKPKDDKMKLRIDKNAYMDSAAVYTWIIGLLSCGPAIILACKYSWVYILIPLPVFVIVAAILISLYNPINNMKYGKIVKNKNVSDFVRDMRK